MARIGLNNEKGLSLIEMTMVLSILGIAVLSAVAMMRGGFELSATSSDVQELNNNSGYALARLSREIRQIAYSPVGGSYAATGNYSITTWTNSNFEFTKNDGNVVSLAISPPNLTMSYSAPNANGILLNNITSAQFSYLRSDGVTAAATLQEILFIGITLNTKKNDITSSMQVRVGLRSK